MGSTKIKRILNQDISGITKPKLRVCAYCRVSSKSEEQLTSYETQVAVYTVGRGLQGVECAAQTVCHHLGLGHDGGRARETSYSQPYREPCYHDTVCGLLRA